MVPFGGVPLGNAPPGFVPPPQAPPPLHIPGSGPPHMFPQSQHARPPGGVRRPEQFKGEVVRMAQDQLGSRRLQDALDRSATDVNGSRDDGEDARAIVLAEVLPQAKTLMHDVFGNYVRVC